MSLRPALIIASLTLTAACGGVGSTDGDRVVSGPTSAFPLSPAFNDADFRAAVADDQRALLLEETRPDRIPTGRATYDGHIRSGALVNGQDGYDLIGDLRLDVDINTRQPIAGRNPVDGSITDLTLIDRFSGDRAEALAGRLSIDGDTTNGEIAATATGTLALDRLGSQLDDEARFAIDLDGSFRNDFGTADVASGDISGGTTGSRSNDFDLEILDGGRFYAED